MYPVTVLLHVLGQLLVFLSDLAVRLFSTVLMKICILLYYWANKMTMMMMIDASSFFLACGSRHYVFALYVRLRVRECVPERMHSAVGWPSTASFADRLCSPAGGIIYDS